MLQIGDEISFTFNKDLDCGEILPDYTNVSLFDMTDNKRYGNLALDVFGFNRKTYSRGGSKKLK